MYTPEKVLEALSQVEDPDLKKDLVTLNMIQDLKIEGNEIHFSLVLTTPACPLKEHIKSACINSIHHFIDKDAVVKIKTLSQVTSKGKSSVPEVKNLIAIVSCKGGVGKSTVAVNTALALAKKGAKVGLIDADIYGPSIPIMLGLEGCRPKMTSLHGQNKMEPIEKYGIKTLSIGFFANPDQAIPWRGPMVSSAVKQLLNDAAWGELDYLVIDMPPGTGDVQITLSQQFLLSGVLIVTTPQDVALADVRKGLGMFKMEGVKTPVLGVVENMSYFTPKELPDNKYYLFGKGGGKKLADQFDVPFLGEIPLVQEIGESGDKGLPIVLDDNHPVTRAFESIAERVAQQVSIQNSFADNELIH